MFIKHGGDANCEHHWEFKNNAQHCTKCDRIEAYYQSQFPFGSTDVHFIQLYSQIKKSKDVKISQSAS